MSDDRECDERERFHPDDPLFTDPPTFASGKSDVSNNVDAYVAEAISSKQNSSDEHGE